MTTNRTIGLIGIVAGLVPFSMWLAKKTGHVYFIALGIIAILVAWGLMFYAAVREQTTDDKSEQVSPKGALVIFGRIGLLLICVLIRALAH